jgi:hypothetical protein
LTFVTSTLVASTVVAFNWTTPDTLGSERGAARCSVL